MIYEYKRSEAIRLRLEKEFSLQPDMPWLLVDTEQQLLFSYHGDQLQDSYPVSTAAKGTGCEEDSFKTPLGVHTVAEKIGEGQPLGMIFHGRQPTGEMAKISMSSEASGEDLITSRILWLQGMEPGINAGEGVDSHDRYIYIHGTNEEGCLGQPVSHGCIRMGNESVVELFDRIKTDMLVVIV